MKTRADSDDADTPAHKHSNAMRLRKCVASALPSAIQTGFRLLFIMIPVSFAVLLMKVTGVLDILATICRPAFGLLGLPGEAAIVFATSCLVNIYACIAVIETLELTGRTITILALMCLIAHNLPVESAVQQKAGAQAWRMILLRITVSFAAGLALSLIIPLDPVPTPALEQHEPAAAVGFGTEFIIWLHDILFLCGKIMILIICLMIIERILHEFGVTRHLARILKYPLMALGLPPQTAFLWTVANTLGLAYGAGVIIDNIRQGMLSRSHASRLNHHIAISHSLFEDTCLFAAIGVSVWWITVPRVIFAGIVVWAMRLIDGIKKADSM